MSKHPMDFDQRESERKEWKDTIVNSMEALGTIAVVYEMNVAVPAYVLGGLIQHLTDALSARIISVTHVPVAAGVVVAGATTGEVDAGGMYEVRAECLQEVSEDALMLEPRGARLRQVRQLTEEHETLSSRYAKELAAMEDAAGYIPASKFGEDKIRALRELFEDARSELAAIKTCVANIRETARLSIIRAQHSTSHKKGAVDSLLAVDEDLGKLLGDEGAG